MQKDADAPPGATERAVHIVGTPQTIAAARELLRLKVEEQNMRKRGDWTPQMSAGDALGYAGRVAESMGVSMAGPAYGAQQAQKYTTQQQQQQWLMQQQMQQQAAQMQQGYAAQGGAPPAADPATQLYYQQYQNYQYYVRASLAFALLCGGADHSGNRAGRLLRRCEAVEDRPPARTRRGARSCAPRRRAAR